MDGMVVNPADSRERSAECWINLLARPFLSAELFIKTNLVLCFVWQEVEIPNPPNGCRRVLPALGGFLIGRGSAFHGQLGEVLPYPLLRR